MGRSRLYATDAERQAEHRYRQQQRQEAEARAHQFLRAQCRRLHQALEAAAAAGEPSAQTLVRSRPEETLEALAAHFEACAAGKPAARAGRAPAE